MNEIKHEFTASEDDDIYLHFLFFFASLDARISTLSLNSFCFRTIYEQLASVSNLEAQDLFQQRVEEIETSIRYCSYKMGKKESIQKLIDNISEDPAVVSLREKLEVRIMHVIISK
jgi:hypothetical protein